MPLPDKGNSVLAWRYYGVSGEWAARLAPSPAGNYLVRIMKMRTIATLSFLAASQRVAPATPASSPGQDLVRATLAAEVRSIRPAQPFWVGVRLQMRDGWHVNWLNPGDAGLAPTVEWDLPEGFVAGRIQWPYPDKFVLPELVIFGYDDEVLLLSEITPPQSLVSSTPVRIKAHVEWLACADVCVPGAADVELTMGVSTAVTEADSTWASVFHAARMALPASASGWGVQARVTHDGITILLAPPKDEDVELKEVVFFPDVPGVIENAPPQKLEHRDGVYHLEIERARLGAETPSRIQGVLVSNRGWGRIPRKAVEIDIEATR